MLTIDIMPNYNCRLLQQRLVSILLIQINELQKFGGSFYHCVENCGKSAVKLLATIVENFESYHDFGDYKGKKGLFFTPHNSSDHIAITRANFSSRYFSYYSIEDTVSTKKKLKNRETAV